VKDAVDDQSVDVGVECDQVAEGLDKHNEAWLAVGIGLPVGLAEQPPDDAAQLIGVLTDIAIQESCGGDRPAPG